MQGSEQPEPSSLEVASRVAIVNVPSEAMTHRRVGNLNGNSLIRLA